MKELADSLWNMPAHELVETLIQFMLPILVVLGIVCAYVVTPMVREDRRMKAIREKQDARLKRLGF